MTAAATLTVLLIHGGGWLYGTPADVAPYRAAVPPGPRVISVGYRLGDYKAGLSDVRAASRAARKRGPVLAVGVSAGGSYAASLAATRDVSAAVAACPVVDYTKWDGAILHHNPLFPPTIWPAVHVSQSERGPLSPAREYSRASAPLRIVHGLRDPLVPWKPGADLAARWPQARFRGVGGVGHCISPAQLAPTVDRAIRLDIKR